MADTAVMLQAMEVAKQKAKRKRKMVQLIEQGKEWELLLTLLGIDETSNYYRATPTSKAKMEKATRKTVERWKRLMNICKENMYGLACPDGFPPEVLASLNNPLKTALVPSATRNLERYMVTAVTCACPSQRRVLLSVLCSALTREEVQSILTASATSSSSSSADTLRQLQPGEKPLARKTYIRYRKYFENFVKHGKPIPPKQTHLHVMKNQGKRPRLDQHQQEEMFSDREEDDDDDDQQHHMNKNGDHDELDGQDDDNDKPKAQNPNFPINIAPEFLT